MGRMATTMAACLVAACCVTAALAFPQYPYGEAAQLGETPQQKQMQADWAQAAHNYHTPGASSTQNAWSAAVAAETPAQMSTFAETATKQAKVADGSDLPYHEPMGGANQKAPPVSLKAVNKQLVGLEEKQVNAAQATLNADRQAEANDEAKVDALRMQATEAKAMENLQLQSDETAYQRSANRVAKDKKKLESDSMHVMEEKMKVGTPEVEKGEYPLPGFPVGS